MIAPSAFVSLITTMLFMLILSGCPDTRSVKHTSTLVQHDERIAQIRKSTVRILVDGKPKGTGFVISEHGLIATAFHVVARTIPSPHMQAHITYATTIEVLFDDGERLPAIIHMSCIGKGLHGSIIRDYCILHVTTSKKLLPLRLGSFSDVYEGAPVYLAGYPLVSDRPCTAFGVVSAVWKEPVVSYHNQLIPEKKNRTGVALLDIAMNRGHSGGPIVLIGETPAEDRVIGIASFISTPLDQELKTLVAAIRSYTEESQSVVCSLELLQILWKERGGHSLFISGCISVDHLKNRILNISRERPDSAPLKKLIPFL